MFIILNVVSHNVQDYAHYVYLKYKKYHSITSTLNFLTFIVLNVKLSIVPEARFLSHIESLNPFRLIPYYEFDRVSNRIKNISCNLQIFRIIIKSVS